MTTKIKALIFDFDGTLADTREIAYQLYVEMAKKYNIKVVSKEELLKIFELPILERLAFFEVPIRKVPKLIREAIKSMGNYIDKAPIYPGVATVIKQLHEQGLPMHIISSNSRNNIKKFIRNNNINYFKNIYGKASIFGKEKRIKKLLKKMKLLNEEVFYIGDEVRDIEACKKANVKVIAISWGYDNYETLVKAKPDFLVENFKELEQIISQFI